MLYEYWYDNKNLLSFHFAIKFLLSCTKRCNALSLNLNEALGRLSAPYRAQYPKWAISSFPVSSLCYSVCNEIEALETPGREILAVPERGWIIGECFSIRSWFDFSSLPIAPFPSVLDIKLGSFYHLRSGMIQPDPRINYLSRVANWIMDLSLPSSPICRTV